MLTKIQRRVQERKQREDDFVDVAERMKKEPKEAGLRTNKAPKDMERVKKAALEEQDSSQEGQILGRCHEERTDTSQAEDVS